MTINYSNNYSKISRCRICKSSNVKSIIDLGSQPLANNLQKNFFKKELKVPLKVDLGFGDHWYDAH